MPINTSKYLQGLKGSGLLSKSPVFQPNINGSYASTGIISGSGSQKTLK